MSEMLPNLINYIFKKKLQYLDSYIIFISNTSILANSLTNASLPVHIDLISDTYVLFSKFYMKIIL